MRAEGFIEAAGWWSYAAVFAATAGETSAFVGLLVPGESVVLVASAVAGRGDLNVLIVAAAVVTGAVTGDNLGYALGRRCARRPGGRRSHRAGRSHTHGRAQALLTHHGGAALFTGRFIGFVRAFLPYAAGVSGMQYRRFFVYSTAASLVWGIGNVLLGYFAGAAAADFLHTVGPIGVAVLATLTVATCAVRKFRGRRGRRPVTPTTPKSLAHGEAERAPDPRPAHAGTQSQR
ncbi:DedA family protein [Streptomyces sp. NPDC059378]|uniref:DedA family protein n=1 Tax=Streptomyces sp. NPDC059378 TaxID=3346815 RepID=UPI0036B2FAC5